MTLEIHTRFVLFLMIKFKYSFLLEEREEDGGSREEMEETSLMSDHPDQETVIEGLKSICNVLLHNETGLVGLLSLALEHGDMNAADLSSFVCGDDRQRRPIFS